MPWLSLLSMNGPIGIKRVGVQQLVAVVILCILGWSFGSRTVDA